jgi:hypothetical protein
MEGRENMLEVMTAYSRDHQLLKLVNSLTEQNDLIADMPYKEATDITSNAVARVTKLPTVSWVKIGEGWTSTMGRIQQDSEGIGVMKGRAQFNKDVLKRQPKPDGYRSNKEGLFLESFAQEATNTAVYGDDATAPEEFRGLDVRFNSLDGFTPPRNGVFNNGETTGSTNSSIWIIQPDPEDCCLIYPRYDPNRGLAREDKGEQFLETDAGNTGENVNRAWFYVTEFEWSIGLSIGDLRRVKRICNIQSTYGDTHVVDEDVIIQALNNFKTPGQKFLYCNEVVYNQLCIRQKDKTNVWHSVSSPFGKPMYYILDTPIRRLDAITNAETIIS